MRKRKGMAVIAAIVMTAVMSLGGSLAATTTVGIENGAAKVKVNYTLVGFAGHEWWVIGDASSGVYPQKNSVTLLAKNHDEDFGNTEFRKAAPWELEPSWIEYDGWWYDGTLDNYPSDYKGSTLQRKMESIANGFSDKERKQIKERTLTKDDDIVLNNTGLEIVSNIEKQKLWSLSRNEWNKIGRTPAAEYTGQFWLRSSKNITYTEIANGDTYDHVTGVNSTRPALNLNVSSVILTSNAGQTGKAAATPGGGLVSVTAPDTTKDGKIKYTFKDDENLKLENVDVSKIEKNTVTVKYDGATGGKNLSLIVKDSKGAVTHYGKLAENIKAESEASFTLPDGFDTTKNKVEVFVEEINGANKSDFASTPRALDIDLSKLKEVIVNRGSGSAKYAEGEEVTLKADPAPAGGRFKHWEISPEVTPIQDTSFENETITFTMPGEDVTATAVYEYSLTVTGGSGSDYYAEGEEVTITADPAPEGKYFKGWNISPAVTLKDGGSVTSGIIKFDMPTHAVTATAEYEDLIVYPIKDGDNTGWTQGNESGFIITSVGEDRKFTGVTVDGNTVDGQHYTVESGSTIVTLKASYLSTLSVGEHVMRIHFTDGYTETKFSIQAAQTDKPTPPTTDQGEPTTPVEPGEANPPVQGGTTTETTSVGTSPKTGDDSRLWLIGSIMAGAALLMVAGRKQKA